MGHRHVCVHGHFYQPPRENPWLGEIEREDSAAPFHDWNERIAEECYGPAALGLRAGSDGRAIATEDLLSRVSFDFGPTLLDWLERRHPTLYRRVIAADRESAGQDGLGNALAHPFYHVILPLASARDKRTLVRWGLADFRARFRREPRGFWLPETAVDDETLHLLAEEGLEFTVLAPSQAEAVRPMGGAESDWTPVDADSVDPKTPYRWVSPKDPSRRLAVFFYHNRLSKGVVTGETTASAPGFVQAVLARLLPGESAQMVHVASDGEFYGHHRPGAERALALALDLLATEGVSAINHSRFLKLFPPPREVRVRARTAWSCEHGLGRWTADCGCRSAHLADWSQSWRGPLREALDRLALRLDVFYEDEAGRFLSDPWKARDESVELRRASPDAARAFARQRAKRALTGEEEERVLRLLAMQRERLAMFTSCGWFFDDVSGVEGVQILQRAARAVDLAESMGERALEPFLERLAAAPSNARSFGSAAGVYRRLVAPTRVTIERVAAHAAALDHCGLWPFPLPAAFGARLGPAFRADKDGLAGRRPTLSLRPAAVERGETLEREEWHALVHRADRLDFACWLLPAGPGPDAAELGARFLALDDAAFRAEMDSRFGAHRWGLDAVLSDERSELVKALASEGSLGPARAEYLRRWTQAVIAARFAERGDDALLELLESAPEHAFLPGDLPWARTLEELLHRRLEAALEGQGLPAYSRALRWLDALWKAQLLTGTWRLRDFQRRWSAGLAGPSAERDACRALGERLGLAEALLEKAG